MSDPILLEVIAATVADAKAAARADRLELVTALSEGGLTPSLGLIEAVVAAVTIPVNVIVRPHSRSFVYEADDLAVIARDVRAAAAAGAHGVVIGMLTAARQIDREALMRISEIAMNCGLTVTFHRAFDQTRDLFEAFDTLCECAAVSTVLTSGGMPSALAARQTIAALVARSRGTRCTVLAGAGLNIESIAAFARETGTRAVHFGSGARAGAQASAPVEAARIMQIRNALAGV